MDQLPAALAPLAEYRQFIVYHVVPSQSRPGKTDKFPINHHTMQRWDAHDPAIWMDAQAAIELANAFGPSYGAGFVFTAADPFVFIDIDGALGPDGWSDLSTALANRFPGAAVELSHSGTGFHIFGKYTSVPPHSMKNVTLGIEMYTERRFAALTGNFARGDAGTDHTAALNQLVADYFPFKAGTEIADWTSEPVPEWHGPADDDELLSMAMRSKSLSSMFGHGVSFADLFEARVDVLAQRWPNPGGNTAYDASSADSALAQRLAFFTGNDCDRIERLMKRSSLVREKWEREDYLQRTIMGVVARQKDVMATTPPEPVAGAPEDILYDPPKPAPVTGTTFLNAKSQIDHFKGAVYIYESHKVLVPGGNAISPEKFKVRYGGYIFCLDSRNDKTTKDAWEAFTQSQLFRAPRVDRACFRPDLPAATIIEDGSRTLVNQYWPAGVKRTVGDASPFIRHMRKLFPNEHDHHLIMNYAAACVQMLGVKFQWTPLIQGVEGNGKTLLTHCISYAVGQRYSHFARADQISEKFNSYLYNRIFIGVEDIYVPESKREVWEVLKPMITGKMQSIEPKGVDADTKNIVCNFLLNSNHKDAVRKTRNDRRLAIFYTPHQTEQEVNADGMGGSYFTDLYDWLQGHGPYKHLGENYGYSIVAELLYTYPIDPSFNPTGRAPLTSSTEAAIHESLGAIEQEVIEQIEQGTPGFKGGWISSIALDNLLTRTGKDRSVPRNRRRQLLESLGYEVHPGLDGGRVNNEVMPDAGKPRLFARRGSPQWVITGGADIARAYTAAQAVVPGVSA